MSNIFRKKKNTLQAPNMMSLYSGQHNNFRIVLSMRDAFFGIQVGWFYMQGEAMSYAELDIQINRD
jgi:hypothetical protein